MYSTPATQATLWQLKELCETNANMDGLWGPIDSEVEIPLPVAVKFTSNEVEYVVMGRSRP